MDESQNKYLEAVKIVANCKPSKLPYVISILKQGGFDFSEDAIKEANKNVGDGRTEWVKDLRKTRGKGDWTLISNPVLVKLREAYDNGLSFSKLSAISGVHRTAIYTYVYGNRTPTVSTLAKLKQGLAELGFCDEQTAKE